MNIFSFIGLMRSIYSKKLPDLEAIQKKGLLAVKIAQHFALRVDFLDPGVCTHLARLFRNNVSIAAENLDALLTANTAPDWRDAFAELETTPFASASIGQVHRAKLRNGTDAVVKIIKQDFKKQFLKDIKTLRRYLKLALFFNRKLKKVFDPIGILGYIEEYTLNELDLQNEIEGKQILLDAAEPYRGVHDLSKMRFPVFVPELSNQKVLVTEFIEGRTFDELLTDGQLSYDKLMDLFNIHGLFLFGPGIFHGDIHPGNIILAPDNSIYFVDTSAVSRVGEKIRRGLFRFFQALVEYDYETCTTRLNEMAEKPINGPAFDAFRKAFYELYADFKGKSVQEVSLTKKMMDSIKLAVLKGMEFEKGMFAIIKSLMYLDGMVLRCRPDADLIKDMKPVIDDFSRVLEKVQ